MEKLFSMLGLARRAGRLLIGRDAVVASVRAGKAALVLLTSDASPRHLQELTALGCKCEIKSIPCTMDDAAYRLGKKKLHLCAGRPKFQQRHPKTDLTGGY